MTIKCFVQPALLVFICVFATQSVFAAVEDKIYAGGCESSRKAAFSALAQSIRVKTEGTTESDTTVRSTWWNVFSGSSVDSTHTSTSKQAWKMALCNTKVKEVNGKYCATVSHSDLVSCAINKLDAQIGYTADKLPASAKKLGVAQKWIDEIASAEELFEVVRDGLDEKKLDTLSTIKNQLLAVLDKQYVLFKVIGENIKIKLDGRQEIQPNVETTIKTGHHSYTISSPGYCSIHNGFQLTSRSKKIVEYKTSDNVLPQLTFKSNQDARLIVDGKSWPLGKPIVIDRCDGSVVYSLTFENKNKGDDISLKPNDKKVITKNFVSIREQREHDGRDKETAVLAGYYKKKTSWQVHLDAILPTTKNNDVDLLTGFRLSRITLNNHLRWGYYASYAISDESSSYSIETGGKIKIQLLQYGTGNKALHLGPFVFMPHGGLEVGLAYRSLAGRDRFEDVTKPGEELGEFEKFYQSFLALRPTAGVDITFHKDISLAIDYARSLFMDEANVFSIGLNIRFDN